MKMNIVVRVISPPHHCISEMAARPAAPFKMPPIAHLLHTFLSQLLHCGNIKILAWITCISRTRHQYQFWISNSEPKLTCISRTAALSNIIFGLYKYININPVRPPPSPPPITIPLTTSQHHHHHVTKTLPPSPPSHPRSSLPPLLHHPASSRLPGFQHSSARGEALPAYRPGTEEWDSVLREEE
jgi:hypothetical protein